MSIMQEDCTYYDSPSDKGILGFVEVSDEYGGFRWLNAFYPQ